MRSSLRAASAALAAALIVAACGSDDSGTGAGAPTDTIEPVDATDATPDTAPADTTPETSAPEEAGQDVEADTAAAEAALLSVADLPAGWTEADRAGDASPLEARLAECVAVDGDRIAAADAGAQSALFTAPEGTLTLTQDIGVLATERDARTVIALTTEPGVPACFEDAYAELASEALAATLAEGAQVGTPVATRLAVGPAGDATQAIRVVVPVTGDPAVVEVTIDHVLVRGGRAVASLTFENRALATPVETIDGTTAAVAAGLGA